MNFLLIVDSSRESKNSRKKQKKNAAATADAICKEHRYQILAVTACPTGIAHTYMAAEGLEKKAKEMGVTIKVETNGSGGAKNVLTDRKKSLPATVSSLQPTKDVAMATI